MATKKTKTKDPWTKKPPHGFSDGRASLTQDPQSPTFPALLPQVPTLPATHDDSPTTHQKYPYLQTQTNTTTLTRLTPSNSSSTSESASLTPVSRSQQSSSRLSARGRGFHSGRHTGRGRTRPRRGEPVPTLPNLLKYFQYNNSGNITQPSLPAAEAENKNETWLRYRAPRTCYSKESSFKWQTK